VKLREGMVAVVTGAANGIGQSLATQLISRGLDVALTPENAPEVRARTARMLAGLDPASEEEQT
jgi:NAD(P)-dependent dehydrogenase (short-subunit alcohol dehydrogenase family)